MDRDARIEQILGCFKDMVETILAKPGHGAAAAASRAVAEKFREVGRQIVQAAVETAAYELAKTRPAPCCEGAAARLVHVREVGVRTLFGEVRIPVRTLRCARCRRYLRPDDAELGVPESGVLADDVREVLAPIVAELPLEVAADLLERTTGVQLSVHAVQGAVASVARDVRREREAREVREHDTVAALRAAHCDGGAQTLGLEVGMDGVMAHVDGAWRETKVATLQVRKVDPAAKAEERLGEVVARRYACARAGPAEFGRRILSTIRGTGWQGLPVVQVLGDGAPWIWRLANALFPGSVQTLDCYHLRGHFFGFASLQWPEPEQAKRWVDEKIAALLEDRVGDVLGALRRTRGRDSAASKALRDLVRYVRTNRTRIRYEDAYLAGFAIGSGAVEGACKHVVQMRFKRPGMRWKSKGFHDVLEIRLARLNGTLDHFSRNAMVAA